MQPATMWAAAAGGVITRGAPLLGKGGSSHHEPLLRAGSSRTACSIIHKHRSIGAGRRALVVSPLAKKGNGGGGSDQEKKGTKRSGKKNETEVLEAIRNSSNGNGVGGNHHDGGNGKAPTGGKNGEQQLFRSGVTGTRADAAAATPIEKVPKPKTYDLTKRMPVDVTPEELEKAALRAQRDYLYDRTLGLLQIELVKMCEWIRHSNMKVLVVFEGRDTAGKGGIISRISSAVPTRVCRVVALPAPTERQKTQWFFQRYAEQLPAGGELVIFDRSWYNRAGVERVMGFATHEEVELFYREVGYFEHSLVAQGIHLIKFWLEVSDEEQDKRLRARIKHSWKRWKLSSIDLCARTKSVQYLKARDDMLARADFSWAPWWVVPSDDKQSSRLNCIQHLLKSVPYENVPPEPLELPRREAPDDYKPPAKGKWKTVEELYSSNVLRPPMDELVQAAAMETAALVGRGSLRKQMEQAAADEYLGPE